MKTQLDTLNATQRALFGRQLYRRSWRLKRTTVSAVTGWTITKGGK